MVRTGGVRPSVPGGPDGGMVVKVRSKRIHLIQFYCFLLVLQIVYALFTYVHFIFTCFCVSFFCFYSCFYSCYSCFKAFTVFVMFLLCFVMFCYVLLCFAMLCYVLLRFAMFCYVLLRFPELLDLETKVYTISTVPTKPFKLTGLLGGLLSNKKVNREGLEG